MTTHITDRNELRSQIETELRAELRPIIEQQLRAELHNHVELLLAADFLKQARREGFEQGVKQIIAFMRTNLERVKNGMEMTTDMPEQDM